MSKPGPWKCLAEAESERDALTVRLAQECALRAQAEQERDAALDDEALERMRAGRLSERAEKAEARLRVADALKREYEEALTEIESKPYRAEEVIARFRAASGGREA